MLTFCNVLNPRPAFDHNRPNEHLNNFRELNQEKHNLNSETGMVCKEISKGDDHNPGIHTVKKESDDGLSARAQGEISTVGKRTKGHNQRGD